MKRASLALGVALVASAQAQERPTPSAYEFDRPGVLAQQLLWGVVHGVRLLALACHRRGDTAATDAYVDWLDAQWPRVRAAESELSRHYFRRGQAPMEAIDNALKLKPELAQSDAELGEACATLPAALATPRYDLESYYREKLKR